ncbi:ANKRD50 [Symbiodinium natans]|uniref:ANKRD50 protein n=1 Tax=Symbiodinium natans TaxID=878477 RepID=A0A812RG40_9DINO|nr:ANKRD50 [Symbiodinium natans]
MICVGGFVLNQPVIEGVRSIQAWWLGNKSAAPSFLGWEDPCGMIEKSRLGERAPSDVFLCVQNAGDVMYFGTGMDHSTCTLSNFSLAVGAQGHTETWPELTRAANRGDLSRVKRVLQMSSKGELPALLSTTAGSYGHAALHRAALHGFEDVVATLLEKGADNNLRDFEGLTPSFLAAFSGHGEVLQTLAMHGVQLSQERDNKGATPLQWAATQGHYAVVDLLLKKHEMLHIKDFHGGGPVSAAATMGHVEVLERLVKERADLEESDERGMQPLHWAALHGHGLVAKRLLHLRARSDALNSEGQSPTSLALSHSRQEVAEVIRTAHKRKRSKTMKGQEL